MSEPRPEPAHRDEGQPRTAHPDRVGPFRILKVLADAGMGTV